MIEITFLIATITFVTVLIVPRMKGDLPGDSEERESFIQLFGLEPEHPKADQVVQESLDAMNERIKEYTRNSYRLARKEYIAQSEDWLHEVHSARSKYHEMRAIARPFSHIGPTQNRYIV